MLTISYSSLVFVAFVVAALLVLALGFGYLFFMVHGIVREQRISAAAAMHALIEVKSMKNATVVQRIIAYDENKAKAGESHAAFVNQYNDFLEEEGLIPQQGASRPTWKKGEIDSGEETYDPEEDPEFDRARDLV